MLEDRLEEQSFPKHVAAKIKGPDSPTCETEMYEEMHDGGCMR